MSLLVVVPTRERPQNAARLAASFYRSCADVVFAVDDTDPRLAEYVKVIDPGQLLVLKGRHCMVEALNAGAMEWCTTYDHIGFMGDDHLPRTYQWAQDIERALRAQGPGIVYCNDLFQGEDLPTAVFMHSHVIRRLGWMAPPTLMHLYVDNAWLDIGRALDSVVYLPDTVVEHMHPHAGKATLDDGYVRVNGDAMYDADLAAYEAWKIHLGQDVARVLA